jgi:SWI/SNF-related matrix-associated actin-dependent regulator 1 of chromatin subfamily A
MTTETVDQAALDAAAQAAAAAQAEAVAQAAATAKAAADKVAADAAAKAEADRQAAAISAFEETGDPALDVSLMYAAQQGLTPESPEIVAARGGDFAKLEAYFKERQAPGWEKQLALAKGAYQRVVADTQAKHKAIADAVFAAAGGEAVWKEASAFVANTASQEQKDQINAALQQGGMVAEAMTRLVVSNYQHAKGRSAKAPSGVASTTAASGELTAREYGRQVNALAIKHKGKDYTQLPEYKALVEQRLAARARGVV